MVFWMPVTYFTAQFLNIGPAARSKGRVTSACSLLPGDYFILLHYFIISWVQVVLHARLYSALLSTVTLNSMQNCCQNRTNRNWVCRSLLQFLDAASCSHGDNLRNTCIGHPVLQKVGSSAGRVWSRRCWEEALGGLTPPASSQSAHSTSASEQKEHSCLVFCNLLLFLDRKYRGIFNRSMEKKQTSLF